MLTLFQEKLMLLDAGLTGKDARTVQHNVLNQPHVRTAEGWLNASSSQQEFYLSDGGYSRIVCSFVTGQVSIFLTSNSTDRVKAQWERHPDFIACIEQELQQAFQRLTT